MSDANSKAQREFTIFVEFMERSGLPIEPSSIRTCEPKKPDIYCEWIDGTVVQYGTANYYYSEPTVYLGKGVSFELCELCSPEIAKAKDQIGKGKPKASTVVRPGCPVGKIVRKKKSREYNSKYPIEILFYSDGRIVLPPDSTVPKIKRAFECDLGPFKRVWFMGQSGEPCECVLGCVA